MHTASTEMASETSTSSTGSEYTITVERDGHQVPVAKVFLPQDVVEADTNLVNQLRAMGSLGIYDNIRVMPDAHAGGACSVGVAARLRAYRVDADGTEHREVVVPSHAGGDLGCGMLTYPLGRAERLKRDKLDKLVRSILPISNGERAEPIHPRAIVTREELESMCREAQAEANSFAEAYCARYKLDISSHVPQYSPA
jgi:predicted RNA binding protein YcfA (HicA-like mRNA interferase family)